MEFESDKFRFFNNYKNSSQVQNDGWVNYTDLGSSYTDPLKNQTYNISYDGSTLQIDENFVDIDLITTLNDKFKADNSLKINKGQIIGYTGSTGNSYQGKKANHLHFNTYIDWKSVLPYETFKEYIGLDISGTETSKKQDGVTPSSEW
ncbi:hypothetical protein [Tenacibaculum geojense]|uniref:Peptidase M23 domain-containing protein n=1 Tax=Tenacibaculum geojense TaxID=915352 RepID=A0ABW3JRK2_9FLAO